MKTNKLIVKKFKTEHDLTVFTNTNNINIVSICCMGDQFHQEFNLFYEVLE